MTALVVPYDFRCPITQEVMKRPVMNKYGINYERRAILEWLNNGNNTCPMTRNPLRPSMLLPNVQLETDIREWLKENGKEVLAPHMAARKVPYDFLCPITQEVMKHPVMNKYGINYERRAILEWLNDGNNTCPMTRSPLRPSMLLPNVQLETNVREWLKENGEEVSEPHRGANNLDFMGFICV
jgi:hypothetical protein